ncbi:MAG: anti-sigma factor family protein, partial [Candidatus Promineifilaceae bacterium]
MLDYLKGPRKSADERRQEALSAYLDGALTPAERQRLERRLQSDAALRQEFESLRWLKRSLAAMPRLRAPRNFTLDPARYGRPQAEGAGRLYPVLRAASFAMAILLVALVTADLFDLGAGAGQTISPAPAVTLNEAEDAGGAQEALMMEEAQTPAEPTPEAAATTSEAALEAPAAADRA